MSGAMSSNVVRTIFAVIMSTIGMVSLGQVGSFGDYSEGVYRQGDYRDLLGAQVHKSLVLDGNTYMSILRHQSKAIQQGKIVAVGRACSDASCMEHRGDPAGKHVDYVPAAIADDVMKRSAAQEAAARNGFEGANEFVGENAGRIQERQYKLDECKRAANLGISAAQYQYGVRYLNGNGVRENKREAFRWISAAAKQGHAGAQCMLGWMYFNPKFVSWALF